MLTAYHPHSKPAHPLAEPQNADWTHRLCLKIVSYLREKNVVIRISFHGKIKTICGRYYERSVLSVVQTYVLISVFGRKFTTPPMLFHNIKLSPTYQSFARLHPPLTAATEQRTRLAAVASSYSFDGVEPYGERFAEATPALGRADTLLPARTSPPP